MKLRYLIPLVVLASVAWVYLVFVVSFYGSLHVPPGYSCHPTITFGSYCTAPDGHTFGGH